MVNTPPLSQVSDLSWTTLLYTILYRLTSMAMLRITFFLTALIVPTLLVAQVPGTTSDVVQIYTWPYAAPHAPRIGGSYESAAEKVRLEIGGRVPLYRDLRSQFGHCALHEEDEPQQRSTQIPQSEFGADFFTWSRLRSDPNFKFPVEAIDYYFGFYGGIVVGPITADANLLANLRLAHISAHLVDGEGSFGTQGFRPFVYSREFLDVSLGLHSGFDMVVENDPEFRRYSTLGNLRANIGARWLFHTIPDTIGTVRPYITVDGAYQFDPDLPVTVRGGYEVGVNSEHETVLEHSLKFGVKFAEVDDNGITLEGAYYHGRSPYGQYFWEMEEYLSLGFSIGP